MPSDKFDPEAFNNLLSDFYDTMGNSEVTSKALKGADDLETLGMFFTFYVLSKDLEYRRMDERLKDLEKHALRWSDDALPHVEGAKE
jgi:hypothetical protein